MDSTTPNSISRRTFLGSAAALTGTLLLPGSLAANILRPSALTGVNLGVISYSFRSMPDGAEDVLGYLVELGLNTVELMDSSIEPFAGAPAAPKNKKDREAHAEEMRKWRISTSMKPFKTLRKKYAAEGVQIEIAKFRMDRMTDAEVKYAFKAAKALGARGITLERSDEAAKRLGPFADKYKRLIGYHNHTKVNFNSWDQLLLDAKYNAVNLDIGHYIAGTNESPIPLIKKYHDRILNLHLKDKTFNNGGNKVWGKGDTPLKEVLQLMKKEQYTFMGTIELEYEIPADSNAVKEVAKCIEFCQDALG